MTNNGNEPNARALPFRLKGDIMRYHLEKPDYYSTNFGEIYICDHPVYSKCTLFRNGKDGLAIIQQRYDPETKHTWWGPIDPWLNDVIFCYPGFKELFAERSGPEKDGLFPTVSIRQIMWALKMKPLPKESWETVFDRKDI